jgi:hypothetical protein
MGVEELLAASFHVVGMIEWVFASLHTGPVVPRDKHPFIPCPATCHPGRSLLEHQGPLAVRLPIAVPELA